MAVFHWILPLPRASYRRSANTKFIGLVGFKRPHSNPFHIIRNFGKWIDDRVTLLPEALARSFFGEALGPLIMLFLYRQFGPNDNSCRPYRSHLKRKEKIRAGLGSVDRLPVTANPFKKKEKDSGRAGQRSPAARDPAGPGSPKIAIFAKSAEISTEKGNRLQLIKQKYNWETHEDDPNRHPSPLVPSSRRPGARTAAPSLIAAASPDLSRSSANRPRPISLSLQARPIRPNAPVQLLFRAVSPSGGPVRSDPTRLSGDFFIYREASQLSGLGKFPT
ncbi:hypothetical protein CRG98_033803 [Punica granatum]|uniref:Uncharacterized protein n=1 Tax=Punica granatum TaxID=22663 RepID=A0A2I0IQU0_PUNGR|nr:hypothetical protein CRG98_033803 [Punica granatum]